MASGERRAVTLSPGKNPGAAGGRIGPAAGLGPLQGDLYPVLSGLSANDLVIISGSMGLRHGSPVNLKR